MPVCVASQCVELTTPKVPLISGRVVKVTASVSLLQAALPRPALEEPEEDVATQRPCHADRKLAGKKAADLVERCPGGRLARGLHAARQRKAVRDELEDAREPADREVDAADDEQGVV